MSGEQQIMVVTTKEQFQSMLIDAMEQVVRKEFAKIKISLQQEQYLTAKQAQSKLGVSFNTFKTYVADGRIKAHHPSALGNPKYLLSEILNLTSDEDKRYKKTYRNSE